MQVDPQIPTAAAFAWRLGFFYFALFAVLGVQLPFLPIWFTAKGLDAGSVGVVLAIPLLVRIFAIPLATHIADRFDAGRAVIVTGAAASLLGYLGLGLAHSAGPIMAAVA